MFCRLTAAVFLFDSVLFGQDVGESARGAARWAVTPFFMPPHIADCALFYAGKIVNVLNQDKVLIIFPRVLYNW